MRFIVFFLCNNFLLAFVFDVILMMPHLGYPSQKSTLSPSIESTAIFLDLKDVLSFNIILLPIGSTLFLVYILHRFLRSRAWAERYMKV